MIEWLWRILQIISFWILRRVERSDQPKWDKDEGPDQRFVQILAANLLTDSKFTRTLSLFPLPELNHSSCPFLFLCVICGIIFLYLLLCCPVLVCSNYLFYVCITACLNLLRFITVIYFCPLYHLLLYSVFLTHSPYILFFSPVLYLLVGHLVFSIWLLFWSFLALCLNLLKKKKKKKSVTWDILSSVLRSSIKYTSQVYRYIV